MRGVVGLGNAEPALQRYKRPSHAGATCDGVLGPQSRQALIGEWRAEGGNRRLGAVKDEAQ
jgi:hypothetical protein